MQDTVLRMVMDKYKPLRIPLGDPGKNAADEKIKAGIQTPSSPFSPPTSPSTSSGSAFFVPPGTDVYVRPPHLGLGAGEDFQPSIYYGQFLKSSSSNIGSDMRTKLKKAGLNPSALPLDDPKAMLKLRTGIKTAERRGKLLRARDSVLDYQLSQLANLPSEEDSSPAEFKGDEVSDTNRNLQLQLGHAQGWDSVIEKRIKAALDSGAFKENKLRGKPIQRDMEEKNPFLAREEYFMNRIVKRQGAAPPWVELNMELEGELGGWRMRFGEGWIRRASRMITTSSTLADGLEALSLSANAIPGEKSGEVGVMPEAKTVGQERLIDVATRYRDAEWEERERAYHVHELKRLNDLIRKHNHLAPFTARKGLMILDVELEVMYKRALPKLVFEISSILHQKQTGGVGEGSRKDGWDENLQKDGGLVSYDVWGREVRKGQQEGMRGKGILDGWLGSSVGSKGGERGGEGIKGGDMGGFKEGEVQSLGILAAIQKSLLWARSRIGA